MKPLGPSDPPQVGPYRIVARLGAGAMGSVYLGLSPTADRVAVKVMRAGTDDVDLRRRFEAEATSLRRVHGTRIARFERAGIAHGVPWLAVEYVPGNSLRQHVDARGPLPPGLVAMLGAQLADGLGKVHAAGLLHRDLKPQNILLGPDGPKVIDFGVSRLFEADDQLTMAGTVVGTPAYMPPEQARADRDLTAAADIYSLAATLAFSATGRPLYPNYTGHGLVLRICDPNAYPDLSTVPHSVRPILTAMLRYEPRERPSLIEVEGQFLRLVDTFGPRNALRADLIRATAIPEPPTPQPAPTTPSVEQNQLIVPPEALPDPDRSLLQRFEPDADKPRRGRNALLIGGVLLLLVGIAALVVILTRTGGNPDPTAKPTVSSAPPPTGLPTSIPPPSSVGNQIELAAPTDRKTSVKLHWTSSQSWDTYIVLIAKDGDPSARSVPVGTRTEYTVSGLEPKAKYCIRIAAGRGAGEHTGTSQTVGIRGAACGRSAPGA